MKCTVLNVSTVAAGGRWDARYGIELKKWLDDNGKTETPENVAEAMQALRDRDAAFKASADAKRAEAAVLTEQARELEEAAELTYPRRSR